MKEPNKDLSKMSHITLYQGDSGVLLPEIISEVSEPVLFWLDGHYSGEGTGKAVLETPIIEEVNVILASLFWSCYLN